MKKNAFTLVELLATIVILAVILVIAVPQIMSVINSTKTSSLESSVKLIAKRAEDYIEEKTMLGIDVPDTFDCTEVAKVSEASYSNCVINRIGTKALVSLDGIGNYEGKYIINGTKNVVEVKETKVTDLATSVIARSGNVNIDETNDKNIRYSGTNPNNYVYFNCDNYSNQTSATCEVWRIIGIFDVDDGTGKIEKRVKIIRDSVGSYSWDTSTSSYNSGYGYNIWETKEGQTKGDGTTTADINDMLNKMYLNNETITCYNARNGVTTTCPTARIKNTSTKDLIGDAVWNLGETTYSNPSTPPYGLPTLDTYNKERGILTGNGFSNIAKTTWTGKVGLIYPSDFGYASDNSECRSNLRAGLEYVNSSYVYTNAKCTKANGNWLNAGYYWTLSPYSSGTTYVFYAIGEGLVNGNGAYNALGVRPVVYLTSSARITSGDGSSALPYKLG